MRSREGPAETGALQRGGGRGEPERVAQILVFSDRQRKSAMENVARAQRIYGVHREGRGLLQVLLRVEPDCPLCPAGPCEEGRG